jgi:hypothetical protein
MIYSRISGARKENLSAFDEEVWVLDCKSEVNASMKIEGQTYPIHPLDLSLKVVDDKRNEICFWDSTLAPRRHCHGKLTNGE